MQLIKARLTFTRTVQETREIPLVDVARFADEDDAQALLVELFDLGMDPDSEVAIYARDLPPGVAARKPTGETYYVRARSEAWLYKTLGIPNETRVFTATHDGGVNLWEPDAVVVVKLHEIADDGFLHELCEMRCPK